MDHKFRCLGRATVVLLLGVAIVGCNSAPTATAKVSGKVTDASGPLKGGNVAFSAAGKGYGSSGIIQADGTYTLSTFNEGDGAPPGDYSVMITDPDGKVRNITGGGGATVKQGANTLDFKVE